MSDLAEVGTACDLAICEALVNVGPRQRSHRYPQSTQHRKQRAAGQFLCYSLSPPKYSPNNIWGSSAQGKEDLAAATLNMAAAAAFRRIFFAAGGVIPLLGVVAVAWHRPRL